MEISGEFLGKQVSFNAEYYNKVNKVYESVLVTGFISSVLLDVNHGCYGVKVKCDNLPYTTYNDEVTFLDKDNKGSINGRGQNINQIIFK